MSRKKIKIIGISCDDSQGDTLEMVKYGLEAAQRFAERLSDKIELETKLIDTGKMDVRACKCCDRRYEVPGLYKEPGKRPETWCVIEDDDMVDVFPEVDTAQGMLIGSPVVNSTFSAKFRLVWERFAYTIYQGGFTFLPIAPIAVDRTARGGLEICLQHMNDCIRWVEGLSVGWPQGAGVIAGPNGAMEDEYGKMLVRINAQRVVQFAAIFALAKEKLGDIFGREFVQYYHPPHGLETWWRGGPPDESKAAATQPPIIKKPLKILGLSAAHRPRRNTWYLVNLGLDTINDFAKRVPEVATIQTEMIDLARETINPLSRFAQRQRAQGGPPEPDKIEDLYQYESDCMKWLWPKLIESDGYFFGAPVFTSSYTSLFSMLLTRMGEAGKLGVFTDKPFAAATAATMLIGGQETCLQHMNDALRAMGMLSINWLIGATGVSGPPYGPSIYEDDGKTIGVQNDKYACWLTRINARRAVEWAIFREIARQELGELFDKEFIAAYAFANELERLALK